jgi:hypothetical protein
MAFAPVIMTGDLEINDTDVSDQVMSFVLRATRDTIRIPATLGARSSVRGGDDQYEVQINFLPDVDATALSMIFWDAVAASPGTITFGGKLRAGATAAGNPRFEGVAQVTALALGGEVNTVLTDSVTFPCLDRPTKSESDV